MYADDLVITYAHTNVIILQENLNHILKILNSYMENNGLVINKNKTKFLCFANRNKIINPHHLNIKITDYNIEKVNAIKFLGVTFDDNLHWNKHIDDVALSLAKYTGINKKIQAFLSTSLLKQLYHTCIESRIRYGIAVWGTASLYAVNKLQIAQNRYMRSIYNLNFMESVSKLYRTENIDKISDIYKKQILLEGFKYIKEKKENSFLGIGISECRKSTRDTRIIREYSLPIVKLEVGRSALIFQLIFYWNSLYNNLRNILSYEIFRKNVKKPEKKT
ncbi:uncharacterized protein LOC111620670 [Centruroides sculpturatus]|uniref:uncharacterized protein LOC111620670 n=1 Tax=Centruroides sculpturatus TaxID=218467 RepID=UPI000C6DC9D1|nr:uncharacterized protein LOC111620670 [Centruroides sculpturatus]